ncbi:dihydrouridine synthase-domain-containing protein [Pyronema domesticum]|nr:dihydrouridine synthase-domain-containing protein [Pyronema domesticum]
MTSDAAASTESAPAPAVIETIATTTATTESNGVKRRKLQGREFYESIGSPKTIVAPMVEQSEFAWRLLSRRHSPANTLCYTPMFHSRLFGESQTYRTQSYQPPHMDWKEGPRGDRPLFVQFCSNDPEHLLEAAKHCQDHCDAVDLNLGCPQGIAKKGHYGSFLQEEPELIKSLISKLHKDLDIPVTAKIRILETKEKSLEYAKMVVDAGAQVLTVHGRTREQKGHNTGLADWDYIKYIRDNLPKEVVMFANGNVLWREDVDACLAYTGVDGVMSAEGNLYNPATFCESEDWDERFPRMDKIGREYLEIIRNEVLPHLPLQELLSRPEEKRSRRLLNEVHKDANLTPIKSHLFKIWHPLLQIHLEVRNAVGRSSTRHLGPDGDPLYDYMEALRSVEKIIAEHLEKNPEQVDENGKWVGPDTEVVEGVKYTEGIEVVVKGKKYRRVVPWYRCQPYYRPLPEVAKANGALKEKVARKAEDDGREEEGSKKAKVEECCY